MNENINRVDLSQVNRRGISGALMEAKIPRNSIPKVIAFFDYLTRNTLAEKTSGLEPVSGKYGIEPTILPMKVDATEINGNFAYLSGDRIEPYTQEKVDEIVDFALSNGYIAPQGDNYITTKKASMLVKRLINFQKKDS